MITEYPSVFGQWQRQPQQNPRQWIYKRVPCELGQAVMDHLTLVLGDPGGPNAEFTGEFHYTARGLTFGNVTVNGQMMQYSSST